jgi:hypothetical protein
MIDISNYNNVGQLPFILMAVLTVDVIVLLLVRYFPDFFGKPINEWYDRFHLNAVLADVFIIFIGFLITRWIYTYMKWEWNPFYFLGLLLVVQLIHDMLFYVLVIKPIPYGHNSMMDVFKDYSVAGWKILVADASMMIGSALLAWFYLSLSGANFWSVSSLVIYILPYILYKTVKF